MMDPIEMRRSVFNPELDALIDSGVVNPKYDEDQEYIKYAICASDNEAWAAEAARLLPAEQQAELAEFGSDPDYLYMLTIRLIEREWDEDVLFDAALHNPNDVLRRGAYSRLTGWSHDETDPMRSHITYAVDPLETVTNKRLTDLCEAVIADGSDEMLVKAAKELAPRLEWERAARAAGILEGSVLDRCGEHGAERVSCEDHDHDHDIDLSAWDNA